MKYVGTMIAAYRPLTALFISHYGAAWGWNGSKIHPKIFKVYSLSVYSQRTITKASHT